MFSPLFFVLMSGVQQKSSVPCPIPQAKGTKLLILSSAVPPGFHPCTDAGRLSERRNGAWPFCTTAVSHRPLRSELQHRYTRKPSQPVKLLSLLQVPAYSLRRCVWSIQVVVILITENHLITFWGSLQGHPPFFCLLHLLTPPLPAIIIKTERGRSHEYPAGTSQQRSQLYCVPVW